MLASLIDELKSKMLTEILESLNQSAPMIASFKRTAQGKINVDALALEIYPWHAELCMAFRPSQINPEYRYSIADWDYYAFVNQDTCDALQRTATATREFYEKPPAEMEGCQAAHLIFLAGAEAILDPSVSELLNTLNVDAHYVGDGIGGSPFEYVVFDVDGTCKANYCDIIRANRTTLMIESLMKK